MDHKTKQIIEKNNRTYLIAMGIVFIAILTTIITPGRATAFGISIGVQIVAMIFMTIMFFKLKQDPRAMHFYLYTILVVYIVSVLSNDSAYIYALMYPICITVVLFMDSKICIKGSVGAIGVNTVYLIMFFARGAKGDVRMMIVQYIFCVITCVVAILVVGILNRHNIDDMNILKNTADEQTETAERIVNVSETIAGEIENANEIVRRLEASVSQSNAAMNEITESVRVNAEAIEHQTFMTGNIQENLMDSKEQAGNMKDASENTMQMVKEGMEMLQQLREQASITAELNRSSRTATTQLNERIKEVEAIIGTIMNISGQTNLLALNASIEAARAGEAGRGFAVVADEIRNLSENTKQSTEQIKDIIEKLTDDAEKVAFDMERSAESSDKQNEMIAVTDEKFLRIESEMNSLSGNVVQISNELNDIVSANTQIMDSIANLSATSEQMAASSQSTMEICDSNLANMQQMAEKLKIIVDAAQNLKK